MALFQRPYERALWLEKLHGYFPNAQQFSQPQAINSEEVDHFFYLGNVTTSDGKSLGLYEIEVRENTRLARNRVQLRQIVAKQCEIRSLDGALAVYWDKQDKWRFSFISIQYRFNDNDELLKEETASKRYTYLIGKGVQTRTVQTRFNQLPANPTLQDLTAAFAVEPLNKEFYNKLYKWYDDAKQHVIFPNDEGIDKDIQKSNSLIRLLTRLLFVWFIKEKGLVNKDLFDPNKLPGIIDLSKPGSYYKAVLQNLFFATLNREINDRSFRTDTKGKPNSTNYLAGNVYRYRDHFLNDKKEDIISLFKHTPFLNGGLFECLDREANDEEKRKFDAGNSLRIERNAIRIDGFSDRTDNGLCVPNSLFFNEEETGLIDLLKQYQFTVEESTPLDVDVALDPELLGKVFENLLADYNPETQASARKASGSYYTPREIVTYMVDESLKAYLKQSLPSTEPLIPDVQSSLLPKVQLDLEHQPEVDNKINALFRYTDSATGDIQDNLFDDAQKKGLIEAIHHIKILDPAVGSGAFPMGILQRLVSLLGVLDPGNEQWKNQQLTTLPDLADIEADLKTAQQINDKKARQKAEEELNKRRQEIEDNFNNRNHDYSRKLYLIENSIFGVDIQSIAIQICKLRFFISLAIEQNPTGNADDNYSIRALPNLETRFVVADTLLGIRGKGQKGLRNLEIEKKEEELNQIRRRYFNARTLKTKRKCREQDDQLRQEIAELLIHDGWNDTDARKIAAWDPYNQSAPAADWFDAEHMFGIVVGFDVVIGNPPYIQLQKNGGELGQRYKDAGYETFAKSGDIYQLFYEKGCHLLKPRCGLLCYITSNSWLKAQYGKATRRYFSSTHTPLRLLEMGKDVFENVFVDANIFIAHEGIEMGFVGKSVDMDRLSDQAFPPPENLWGQLRPDGKNPWSILTAIEQSILDKLKAVGIPLKEWEVSVYRGITTGLNSAFIIDNSTRLALISDDPKSAEILKPVLRGKDIRRYVAEWACLSLIGAHNGYDNIPAINIDDYPAIKAYLKEYYPQLAKRQDKGNTPYNLRSCSYHGEFAREKLFWADMSTYGRFAYSDTEVFCNDKGYILTGTSLKYLCAILNSNTITWFMRNTSVTTGMGLTEWKIFAVERIPIPKILAAEQEPFICLIDNILTAKTDNPKADTSADEAQIDRLVYELYGLTDTEIAIVEGNMV